MITITLPPELEQAVIQRAQRQGTTPELRASASKFCWVDQVLKVPA